MRSSDPYVICDGHLHPHGLRDHSGLLGHLDVRGPGGEYAYQSLRFPFRSPVHNDHGGRLLISHYVLSDRLAHCLQMLRAGPGDDQMVLVPERLGDYLGQSRRRLALAEDHLGNVLPFRAAGVEQSVLAYPPYVVQAKKLLGLVSVDLSVLVALQHVPGPHGPLHRMLRLKLFRPSRATKVNDFRVWDHDRAWNVQSG
ncbi:MAG: hypothetical protein BWY99_02825 [Synergistetes bacterium ADurb.BinA166]|nr:MAG: hypothetical protein BWY99_02825 [Synergistetes bacterium ADurb.BinA166]